MDEKTQEVINKSLELLELYKQSPAKDVCHKWSFSESAENLIPVVIKSISELFTKFYDMVSSLKDDQVIAINYQNRYKDNFDEKDIWMHEFITTTNNFNTIRNKFIKYDSTLRHFAERSGKTYEDIVKNIENDKRVFIPGEEFVIVRVFAPNRDMHGIADEGCVQVFPFKYFECATDCVIKTPWTQMLYNFVARNEDTPLEDGLKIMSFEDFENHVNHLVELHNLKEWK